MKDGENGEKLRELAVRLCLFLGCMVYSATLQGDHSGCVKPRVDIKTKVVFQYILRRNFCLDVNGTFDTT